MIQTTSVAPVYDPSAPFNLAQHSAYGRYIRSTPWRIGAWYNVGIANGRSGADMALESDLALQTLKNAGAIVAKFGSTVDGTSEGLSFEHYKVVQGQTPERARQLLAFAADNELSQAALREHIREERSAPVRDIPPEWPHIYEVIDAWNAMVAVAETHWTAANDLERRTFVADVREFLGWLEAS